MKTVAHRVRLGMKTAQHWPVQKRRPSQAKKVAAMLVAVVAVAGAIVVKTHQKVPIQYKQLKRPLLQTFRHKLNAALRPHAQLHLSVRMIRHIYRQALMQRPWLKMSKIWIRLIQSANAVVAAAVVAVVVRKRVQQ